MTTAVTVALSALDAMAATPVAVIAVLFATAAAMWPSRPRGRHRR